MSNLNIKLDLTKLKNAQVTESKSLGKCVVIPVKENEIFLADSGSAYLDLAAREMKEERYGQTHFIKRRVSKRMYKEMSEEERKSIPIIGNVSPEQTNYQSNNNNSYNNNNQSQEAPKGETASDDLPF